jgi:outer membrane protein TolC
MSMNFRLIPVLTCPLLGAGLCRLGVSLFGGGARMQQSIDDYDASIADYRQAVLVSFQQAEDNLAALHILEEEMLVQNKANDIELTVGILI